MITTASLYQELEYKANKPVLTVLLETDFTKEIRITMQAGTVLKEHKSQLPIVVQVVEGSIDFGVEQEIHHLERGDLIAVESNILHHLKAKENSIVRLSLNKLYKEG